MDENAIRMEARFHVLETLMAEMIAKQIPDEETLRSWTEGMAAIAKEYFEEPEGETAASIIATSVWDDMFAAVRIRYAVLRAAGLKDP